MSDEVMKVFTKEELVQVREAAKKAIAEGRSSNLSPSRVARALFDGTATRDQLLLGVASVLYASTSAHEEHTPDWAN